MAIDCENFVFQKFCPCKKNDKLEVWGGCFFFLNTLNYLGCICFGCLSSFLFLFSISCKQTDRQKNKRTKNYYIHWVGCASGVFIHIWKVRYNHICTFFFILGKTCRGENTLGKIAETITSLCSSSSPPLLDPKTFELARHHLRHFTQAIAFDYNQTFTFALFQRLPLS